MNENTSVEDFENAVEAVRVGSKKSFPEKVLFKPDWHNRHTRRSQFGGMSAPEKAGGVRKNPNCKAALEGAALAYIQEKVTCKVWEIPVRPETSSEHRAFIRRLEREGKITRDPGYIHALAEENTSNNSKS